MGVIKKLAAYLTAVCLLTAAVPQGLAADDEELRGVWVVTVYNLDYPSSPTTDSAKLKAELDTVMDNAADMGFNAVFLQVRPSGDAFYKSNYFPWSAWLTGTQGTAPSDGFDPFRYAVTAAHERGLQLHAWLNPYRVTTSESTVLSEDNPALTDSSLVIKDANGKLYYNPASDAALELIVNGAAEIAEGYDVDGIHLDDYFYPEASFDDSADFAASGAADIADWRRSNVNRLVQTLDTRLHEIKPDIVFGISPRGIWANKSETAEGSDTSGFSSYSGIYADSRAWVKNGWVDYIMPQLYWNIGNAAADYSVLMDWWSDVVRGTDVKLYTGEGVYRLNETGNSAWTGDAGIAELRTHILLGRQNDAVSGFCCYKYSDLIKNSGAYALIKELSGAVGASGFLDMTDYAWAEEAVGTLADNGIVNGVSDYYFAPAARVTRADSTILLLRALGKTAEFTDNFDDVSESKYYYSEIGAARALGIAAGVGDNLFKPEAEITREDFAVLVYRAMLAEKIIERPAGTSLAEEYSDFSKISAYAREAVEACLEVGILHGTDEAKLNPKAPASRAETAVMIYNLTRLL